MATPVASQKVRLGTAQCPRSGGRTDPLPSFGAGPEVSRRMPVAAPARTASTLTTGLAKAR